MEGWGVGGWGVGGWGLYDRVVMVIRGGVGGGSKGAGGRLLL